MVQIKRKCDEVFEAVLIEPVGNTQAQLEKAYDTVSDLLDLWYEVRGDVCNPLVGSTREIVGMQFEVAEGFLLKAQSFLNSLVVAKNEKTVK